MPSTFTSSGGYELQATGENANQWGARLNTSLTLLDERVDGVATTVVTGNWTLTITNAAASPGRRHVQVMTGSPASPFTVTLPGRTLFRLFVNSTGQTATITTGSGATAAVRAGQQSRIYCDGTNVYVGDPSLDTIRAPAAPVSLNSQRITSLATPTAGTDAATKGYVDGVAFNAALPGGSAAGQVAIWNGTVPVWGALDLADADARTGILPASNGGTGRSTIAAGSVLVGNGTGVVNLAAPGAAGQVLTSAGAGVLPVFAAGPGWIPVGSLLTPSAAASLNVTLTGGYSEYRLAIWEFKPATDNVQLWLRTSTNAGVSFDSGGSDYDYVYSSMATTQPIAASSSGGDAKILISGQYNVGSATNENGVYGEITIFRPTAANWTVVQSDVAFAEASTNWIADTKLKGRRRAAADVDTIQLLFSTGNIASGFAQLYARVTA
jgi:hypothetical protein